MCFHESVKHAYSHVTTLLMPCVTQPHPLSEKSMHMTWTWHALHQGLYPSWTNCIPMPGGQHAAILAQWKWGHPCLGSRPPFGSKLAQWGVCLDSVLATSCCNREAVMSRAVWTVALSWTYPKSHRPGEAIVEMPDVSLAVEGVIQHHQFTSPIVVNATPTLIEERCYRLWDGCMRLSVSVVACDAQNTAIIVK